MLFNFEILILPLFAGLVAQIIKFFIKSNNEQFTIKNLVAYSGMPSGHSALTISLATIVGLKLGLSSPIFAVTLVIAILVIRDAVGLRRYLGQHGKVLNILVEDLKEDKMIDDEYPHLLEKIGHTPAQVIVGGVIGFIISVAGYYLL